MSWFSRKTEEKPEPKAKPKPAGFECEVEPEKTEQQYVKTELTPDLRFFTGNTTT